MAKQGPKDVNELAFGMMQRFTGEDDDSVAVDAEHAVSGSMGGAARAKRLTRRNARRPHRRRHGRAGSKRASKSPTERDTVACGESRRP